MQCPGSRTALEGSRILLVEDAADIRDAFEVLLRAEGAQVVAVATGRAALDAARHQHFDVVLTDLGLPDVPGDVLIRGILGLAASRPRVVVVTGYGEPHGRRAREAGADAVMTKPIEWADLLNEVRAGVSPLTETAA
jgi:DNA-binding response OmpR family regulator